MRKIISIFMLVVGMVLVVGAGILVVYTQEEEHTAQVMSYQVTKAFFQSVPKQREPEREELPEEEPVVEEEPAMEIDGTLYLGVLSIPRLGLELPIANVLTYPQLKHTPAVLSGTVEGGDLIIGGHNFAVHFGNLRQLPLGDVVTLVDANGTAHQYAFVDCEQVDGNDLDGLVTGEWDMSLFTCLYENNALRSVYRFAVVA